eukprot:GHVT01020977.1.p1 GENE.GHVT01020977.1~~GHVT01020977.1.p1  ORF type:complete len:111 (-),score=16.32 GHVT01020977.1:406-738(-)
MAQSGQAPPQHQRRRPSPQTPTAADGYTLGNKPTVEAQQGGSGQPASTRDGTTQICFKDCPNECLSKATPNAMEARAHDKVSSYHALSQRALFSLSPKNTAYTLSALSRL